MAINVHCNQLSDFLRIYVLDWHVLCALIVPFLFALFFPIYWFVICPAIWKADLALYRPRSWLIGYWLMASLIWFVFLAICLLHIKNTRTSIIAIKGATSQNRSESTEDLWNEDSYIPDGSFLIPPPDYYVNVSAVQPSVANEYSVPASPNPRPPTSTLKVRPELAFWTQDGQPGSPGPFEYQYQQRFNLPYPPGHLGKSRAPASMDNKKECLLSAPPPLGKTSPTPTMAQAPSNGENFDGILASLQNLATELERDFDVEQGVPHLPPPPPFSSCNSVPDLPACSTNHQLQLPQARRETRSLQDLEASHTTTGRRPRSHSRSKSCNASPSRPE